MQNGFSRWLNIFLSEKNYDMAEQVYTCDIGGFWGQAIIEGGVLLQALHAAPASEQKAIKTMLVKIDFANKPIHPYFTHLATAMAKNAQE